MTVIPGLDLLTDTTQNDGIIAAGPLTKQPGTMPFRVVMRVREDEYMPLVVCIQQFDQRPDGTLDLEKAHYHSSNYLRREDLVRANWLFAERVAYYANTMASLYREEPATAG